MAMLPIGAHWVGRGGGGWGGRCINRKERSLFPILLQNQLMQLCVSQPLKKVLLQHGVREISPRNEVEKARGETESFTGLETPPGV